MIKRILILFLLFPALAWGGFSVDGVTDPASVDGVAEPASVDGVTSDYAVSSCPSYYASAIWSWNGDHTSGHNYGCTQAGVEDVAETDTVTTGTDYGEDGSVGMLLDENSTNQYLAFTQTANQYVNPSSAQTICLRVKISGTMTTSPRVFWSGNGADFVEMYINTTNNTLVGAYNVTTGTDQTAFGLTPLTGNWYDIAYSWNPNGPPMEDGDHSANPGDGVWAETWDPDTDELDDEMTNSMETFRIGTGDPALGAGLTIYITDFAIVPGYQSSCPWQ